MLTTSVFSQFTQLGTSSPYSRFGLGDLVGNVLPEYIALGSGVTSISSRNTINSSNPASYTSFNPNSFLFSTGGVHTTTNIQNLTDNHFTNNNSFSHLKLAFPLSRKIGASAGMLPYSNIGYTLNALEDGSEITYLGDGGISKIYFGGAYEPFKDFSIGINAAYLFGGLNKRKLLVFNDETFFSAQSNSIINLKGYFYEIGLMYKKHVTTEEIISFGLAANNNSSISAKRTNLAETFSNTTGEIKDTSIYTLERGTANLPKYLSLGVSYSNSDKWLLLADYSMQNWEDYSIFNKLDNLNNSMTISAGAEYTPDFNSVTKYYKRMQYRLGVRYSNTPILLNEILINEMSLSFGVGIPIRKSRTKYDASVTIGQRGTKEDNLIREQFIRFGLSISYDGVWFVKRKYD